MKQKFTLTFLLFCFLSAPLISVELEDIVFEYNADGTATVAKQDVATILGDLELPETVEHDGASYTITAIADSAFFESENLGDIYIPKSVVSIGKDAFFGCTGISNFVVDAANTVYSAENGVLFSKDKTILYMYPTSKSEASYKIPEGVTTIGDYAFYMTIHLTGGVTIPGTVTTICDNAFHSSFIPTMEIPEGVITIGNRAFYRCIFLTSISFSKTVSSIGTALFPLCNRLSSVTVDRESEYYCAVDNVLYDKHQTRLVGYSPAKTETSFSVPSSVKVIGKSSFTNATKLVDISLPKGLTTIEDNAFENCMFLASIEVPYTVTSLGEFAFRSCMSMTSAIVGNGVEEIKTGTFYSCVKLAELTLGSGVKRITKEPFFYCNALTTLHCQAQTPPECSAEAFAAISPNIALYVPQGTLTAYENAPVWSEFLSITEETIDAIGSINATPLNVCVNGNVLSINGVSNKQVALYSVTGALLKDVRSTTDSVKIEIQSKGIYLVKVGDQVRKVFFK